MPMGLGFRYGAHLTSRPCIAILHGQLVSNQLHVDYWGWADYNQLLYSSEEIAL